MGQRIAPNTETQTHSVIIQSGIIIIIITNIVWGFYDILPPGPAAEMLVSRRLMTLGIFLSYKNDQSILLRWNGHTVC